jgi:hypothetical protein
MLSERFGIEHVTLQPEPLETRIPVAAVTSGRRQQG